MFLPRGLAKIRLEAEYTDGVDSKLTPANVVRRVLAAIRAEPPGDSIDVDAIRDENAFRAHCV